MKIEVRGVKVYKSLSEETLCFQASIYLDGKKVGEAENRGTGGNTNVLIMPRELQSRMEAWVKNNVPDGVFDTGDGPVRFPYDLESYIDKLVEEHEEERERAKLAKKNAKLDAEQKAHFAAKGWRCMRWTRTTVRQIETRWFGIPPGKTPEEIAAMAEQKYGHKEKALKPMYAWEVL